MAIPNVNGFRVKKGNETGITKIATDAILDKAVTKAKLSQPVQTEINKVANKADQDGDYDSLTAGGAKQLLSTVYVDDNEPYNFRTAGGSADIGDRMYEEVVGGSIVWNELYDDANFATAWSANNENHATASVSNNVLTLTLGSNVVSSTYLARYLPSGTKLISGHVYLQTIEVNSTKSTLCRFMYPAVSENASDNFSVSANAWTKTGQIIKMTADSSSALFYFNWSGSLSEGDAVQFKNAFLCDLTQMFGSTIADYIYSLEQGTAGAGVAWFRKLFPKPYYAYNAGELMSVKAGSHDTVGFNAWDEEWELGLYQSSGKATSNNYMRCKNLIPVIEGQTYRIERPCRDAYTWGYADKNYSNGVSISEKSNGNIEIPTGVHYLGFSVSVSQYGSSTYKNDMCVHLVWDGERNGEYEPYEKHTYPLAELELRGIPKLDANNQLYYDGDTYASDGTVTRKYGIRAYQSGDESLADAITDGTNTVYKLSTPTTETADTFVNLQVVDDFGTEEYTDYAVEAGDRDVAIPVGHNSQYMNNLRAKLEMAPVSPSGDGKYIVQQSNGENAYIPYTADGRLDAIEAKLPAPPSANGTYKLTATVTDGGVTYTWVAG